MLTFAQEDAAKETTDEGKTGENFCKVVKITPPEGR